MSKQGPSNKASGSSKVDLVLKRLDAETMNDPTQKSPKRRSDFLPAPKVKDSRKEEKEMKQKESKDKAVKDQEGKEKGSGDKESKVTPRRKEAVPLAPARTKRSNSGKRNKKRDETSDDELPPTPAKKPRKSAGGGPKLKVDLKKGRTQGHISVVFPGEEWPRTQAQMASMDINCPPSASELYAWRCPYCRHMTNRRLALIKHIESKHKEELKSERHGIFGAARRMENLSRIKMLGRARFIPYFKLLRQFDLTENQRASLRAWARMILAEGSVLLGDEDSAVETHIDELKSLYFEFENDASLDPCLIFGEVVSGGETSEEESADEDNDDDAGDDNDDDDDDDDDDNEEGCQEDDTAKIDTSLESSVPSASAADQKGDSSD